MSEVTDAANRILARVHVVDQHDRVAVWVEDAERVARAATQADALAQRVAELEDAGDLMDRMIGAALIPVTDCREACDHPACNLLRARSHWRRIAARPSEGQGSGDDDR